MPRIKRYVLKNRLNLKGSGGKKVTRTTSALEEIQQPMPVAAGAPAPSLLCETSGIVYDQPPHLSDDIRSVVGQRCSSKLETREELLRNSAEYRNMSKRPAEGSGEGIGLFNISEVRSAIDAFGASGGSECEECGQQLEVDFKTHDLDTGIVFRCEVCEETKYDSKITTLCSDHLSEATAGVVNFAVSNGGGLADCNKFVSNLNLNKQLSQRRYAAYKDELHNQTNVLNSKYRPAINECVLSQYERDGIEPEEDGLLNVDVSYDGSWLTRGHGSNIVAGYVMETETAFVLDFEVLSKFCQRCTLIKNKFKNDADRCIEEIESHKQSGQCTQNYDGPSGGMEKQMALNMWRRSAELNGMRYTTLSSDGDSSSFNALQEDELYDRYPVEKKECVNHSKLSIHSKLWSKLRETKNYGLKTVQHAAAQTANEHNIGYAKSNVLEAIGFAHSAEQRHHSDAFRDKRRLSMAMRKDKKKYYQNADSDNEDDAAGGF